MDNHFETLSGGNMSTVLKSHNHIFRLQQPYSETIHRLLKHLEKSGFEKCPRFIAVDEMMNMEILSFVEGECKHQYPFTKDQQIQLKIISDLATLIRLYHDATASFIVRNDDQWMFTYEGNLEKEVICHNDIAPYNVTFQNERPFGLIDFDTCCPGPRIWDIVYALYRFVPLSKEIYDCESQELREYDVLKDKMYRKNAIKFFFDMYGLPIPADFKIQLIARLKVLADYILNQAQIGNTAFIKMLEEGHRDFYLKEIEFLKNNISDWID